MVKFRQGTGRGGNFPNNQGSDATNATTSYRVTTPCLESALFNLGSAKDAADFEKTKQRLSLHVSTQSWKGAGVASNAMDSLHNI